MATKTKKALPAREQEALLSTLKKRFENAGKRHQQLSWQQVETRLKKNPTALWSLNEMEQTGGEPALVFYNEQRDEYVFMDCAAESPAGRRSLCYDLEGWESRKENRPAGNAVDMAEAMGIELLTEEDYRDLQGIGSFDAKTSSWLKTPENVRDKGGSIFGDLRYGRVFVYHNGAQSYYGARGFRGKLVV